MYKTATRLKLRFDVVGAGRLSVEQLWSTNIDSLITTEETLQTEVEKLGSTSRRKQSIQTKAGEELKLKLAIISDVLDTIQKEQSDARDAEAIKRDNQEIDELIAAKRKEDRSKLSIEDLEKLRK